MDHRLVVSLRLGAIRAHHLGLHHPPSRARSLQITPCFRSSSSGLFVVAAATRSMVHCRRLTTRSSEQRLAVEPVPSSSLDLASLCR